jgi:hypothetical protein
MPPSANIAAASANNCNGSMCARSRLTTCGQWRASQAESRSSPGRSFPALRRYQERALEFERDDDREDHAKHGLKHELIGGIKGIRENEAKQDLEQQIPNGYDYDDGDQSGQDQNNDKLFVER